MRAVREQDVREMEKLMHYLDIIKAYANQKFQLAYTRLEQPYQARIQAELIENSITGWKIGRILNQSLAEPDELQPFSQAEEGVQPASADADVLQSFSQAEEGAQPASAESDALQSFSQAEEGAQPDMPKPLRQHREGALSGGMHADFAQSLSRLEEEGEFPYLEYLMERFALTPFECHCVRMMYVLEMDADYADMAAFLQDGWEFFTPYLARLTFADDLDDRQLYGAFGESSLLGRFFLAEYEDEQAFCVRRLRLDKRIVEFACGELSIAPLYAQLVRCQDETEPLEPWSGPADTRAQRCLEQALSRESGGQIFYIYGQEGSGRRFSIRHACRKTGRLCCQVYLDGCCGQCARMDERKAWRWRNGLLRELLFLDSVPVFVTEKKEKEEIRLVIEQMKPLLRESAAAFEAVFLCAVSRVSVRGLDIAGYIEKRPLTLLEGRRYWETQGRQYRMEAGADLGSMSSRFQLTPGSISAVMKNADKSRMQEQEACLSMERITRECYELMEQQMGKKAVKVPAVYTMDDLILPKRQKQQLLEACSQIQYRHKVYEEWGFHKTMAYGRGAAIVFTGPPGTGKTMAAQVIARELGMQLYKADLSCIVSKYVGETEKNLEEIFEQAEKSRVILMFDEADVLFGKRSEGKESMDKYSNMEAAFLLQKMECYEGAAILATNLFHHFDEAFKRRMKVVVEFPVPGVQDRKKIWKSMLPQQMPHGEIDFDYLAGQFELTGSSIRSILLHSAFLAAAKGRVMDMEEIIPAVKNEYAKNGKHLSKNDVSQYYMYLE